MARLWTGSECDTGEADSFLNRIDKLFGHLKEVRTFRIRIEGIDRDAQRFADDVKTLAQAIAPDLADRAPEVAVPELYQRLAAARDPQRTRYVDLQSGRRRRQASSARETIAHDRAQTGTSLQGGACRVRTTLRRRKPRPRNRLASKLSEIGSRTRSGTPVPAFRSTPSSPTQNPSIPTPSN